MLLAFSCFLPLLLLAVVFLAGSVIVAMVRDPDLHVWPSITRCRLCEKRVYVWQKHEYRDYEVTVENPGDLPESALAGMSISGSGIVHRRCQGTPRVTCTVHAAKDRGPSSAPTTVRPTDRRPDN